MRMKLSGENSDDCADLFKNFNCALYYPTCVEETIRMSSNATQDELTNKVCWETCSLAYMACSGGNEEEATFLCKNYLDVGLLQKQGDINCYAAAPHAAAPLLVFSLILSAV